MNPTVLSIFAETAVHGRMPQIAERRPFGIKHRPKGARAIDVRVAP
jgi:hypothetical protein